MCVFMAGAAAGGMASAGAAISAMTSLMAIPLSIMQSQAQNQAAAAQYAEQVRFRQEQGIQLQKTLNQQVAQQQAALESEKDKAQGELADNAIRANKARSTAQVGSVESGIVGLSVDALQGDITGQEDRYAGRIIRNSDMATANATNSLKMAQRGGAAKLASIPIPVRPQFNTGLQIGAAIVSGLGNFGSAIA